MRTQLFTPFLKTDKGALLIFFLVGYLVAFFLYFIDEGNFHFNNLIHFNEWMALSFYALIFVGCFRLVYGFFKKSELPHFSKLLFSVILGLGVLPLIVMVLAVLIRVF